jgi:hypothetical protein
MPGSAFPERSMERANRLFSEAMDALPQSAYHQVVPNPKIFIGPELHDTQIRAYALIAAAQLQAPSPRWNRDDIVLWERKVLDAADVYAHYIKNGPAVKSDLQESEDSP